MKKTKYSSSMFIAETVSGVPSPVFWDAHSSIYNTGAPVTTITGATGKGKTFGGLVLGAMSAVQGKTTIVIDYKGDMLKLAPLREELGVPVKIWDLSDDSLRGILDPFGLTDEIGEQLKMAINLIDLFVGGLDRQDRQAITPILKDIVEQGGPTMMKVVTGLRGSRNETARLVGSELEVIKSMKYSGLCFYSGLKRRKPPKLVDGGITIATLANMDLPKTPEEARESQDGRLASGILYLLTDYIRRILASDDMSRPKTFMIDEAWAILSTPAGLKIVKAVALLGRSRNLATILITQNPLHLAEADIKSAIGTRFSFGVSKDEAKVLVQDMDLPEGEGFETLISGLDDYICMMSDYKSDYGLIRFSGWRAEWVDIFSTNPHDAMRKQREKKEAKARAIASQQR